MYKHKSEHFNGKEYKEVSTCTFPQKTFKSCDNISYRSIEKKIPDLLQNLPNEGLRPVTVGHQEAQELLHFEPCDSCQERNLPHFKVKTCISLVSKVYPLCIFVVGTTSNRKQPLETSQCMQQGSKMATSNAASGRALSFSDSSENVMKKTLPK